MLRCTGRRFAMLLDTCVPSNFMHATDLAFYFPRFQPHSHLYTRGIPELQDALALLQPAASVGSVRRWSSPRTMGVEEWGKCRDSALALLIRAEEIMENVGGVKSAATADVLRPLYATKFELLNGIEFLPRSRYARSVDVYRMILKQSGRLLFYNGTWDRSDRNQLDVACVILSHFVRAFCALHQRPFHAKEHVSLSSGGSGVSHLGGGGGGDNDDSCGGSKSSAWSMPVERGGCSDGVLTLPVVMHSLDELLYLSRKTPAMDTAHSDEFRWNVPKLLLLKGILTMALTGNLAHARKYIDDAAKTVYEFRRRDQPIVDGLVARKQEPELGLFMLAQAEMAARVFDWSVAANKVDKGVLEMFEAAAKFYSAPYNTPLDADGIMSGDGLDERRFETDAYASCMQSYGTFLLTAPRPPGVSRNDSPVFLPQQLFTMSPIATVATSSDVIFTDVQELVTMTIDVIRKQAGMALERALQLNRTLYPEHRQNPKAGWTLLSMASLYADMRDYLYAMGLFSSAEKALVENYGNVSLERLLVLKLRYEFLAGVGSDQEAKTAAHEVVQLLKHMDGIPRE